MTTIPPDDPLRRKPPTIDLAATEVKKAGGPDPRGGSVPATGPSKDKPATAAKDAKPAAEDAKAGKPDAKPASPPAAATAKTASEPMATTGLDGAKPASASAIPPAATASKPSEPVAKPAEPASPAKPSEPVGAAKPAAAAAAAKPEPVKPEPVKPAASGPAPATRSGAGAGSLLAASVVGGLVGAGLLYAAERYALPQPENLGPRIAALESRPAAPSNATPPEALIRRIDALEAGRQDLAGAVAQARSQAEAAAKQASDAAARPVAGGAAPPDPAIPQAIEGLQVRLGTVEGAAAGALDAAKAAGDAAKAGAAAVPEQVDALRTRFDGRFGAIEAGVKSAGDGVAALRTDLTGLQTGLGELRSAQQTGIGRIAAVESGSEALRARLDEAARRGEDQGKRLDAAAAELAKLSPAALQAGLRLVVADRLGDTIRAGAPLGPVTASLARLGADPAVLAPLKPFADAPPPAVPTLAREFAPLAERMTTEPRPAPASIGDRLLRMADKIVAVRDLGDGSGTDLPGLVGRIEAALGRGDAAAALASWTALPETAKSISAAWAEKLKSRVAVEEAARKVGQDALAALEASAPATPATR